MDTKERIMINIITAVLFMALMLISLILVYRWRRAALDKLYNQYKEKDNSYTVIISKKDYGFTAAKLIVNTDGIAAFKDTDPLAQDFEVSAKAGGSQVKVNVSRAYLCDIDGNSLEESRLNDPEVHICLELETEAVKDELSPLNHDLRFEIRHKAFAPVTECSEWFCPDKAEQAEFEQLRAARGSANQVRGL